jgi:large subunit ribosomal protein L17
MNDSNPTEIEQGIGNEVDHFVVRAPKRNHDAMVQLGKQFADILKKYGGPNPIYFELNNTEAPMEGITNIAKIVSAKKDEDVWLQLTFYRDRNQRDEVRAKMGNDESMGQINKQFMDLISPGSMIMGEFVRLKI